MKKSNSLPSTTSLTSTCKLNSSNSRKIIISSIFLVALFCFIAFINDIRIEHVLSIHKRAFAGVTIPFQSSSNINFTVCSRNNNTAQPTTTVNSTSNELRILIGVLALADHYRPRNFLRRVYQVQPRPPGVRVDVKFIFCNLTKEDQKILVPLEISTHDDIIILNCTENMDSGKTYTYFSSLPSMFSDDKGLNPPYHYVMKTDYDTFVRVPNLAESLNPLPREDLYYGFAFPCKNLATHGDYMSGMGYVLSWDIVEWISRSEIPRNHQKGPEDRVTGQWLKMAGKGNNSYNAKWKMYDYPKPRSACTHPLWPDTIAVHSLKTVEKWVDTLSYFNFTKDLVKPSKFYHF